MNPELFNVSIARDGAIPAGVKEKAACLGPPVAIPSAAASLSVIIFASAANGQAWIVICSNLLYSNLLYSTTHRSALFYSVPCYVNLLTQCLLPSSASESLGELGQYRARYPLTKPPRKCFIPLHESPTCSRRTTSHRERSESQCRGNVRIVIGALMRPPTSGEGFWRPGPAKSHYL